MEIGKINIGGPTGDARQSVRFQFVERSVNRQPRKQEVLDQVAALESALLQEKLEELGQRRIQRALEAIREETVEGDGDSRSVVLESLTSIGRVLEKADSISSSFRSLLGTLAGLLGYVLSQ